MKKLILHLSLLIPFNVVYDDVVVIVIYMAKITLQQVQQETDYSVKVGNYSKKSRNLSIHIKNSEIHLSYFYSCCVGSYEHKKIRKYGP